MPDKNEKKIAAIVMAMLVALYLLGIAGGIAALAGLLGPLEGRAAVPFLLTFLLAYILAGGATILIARYVLARHLREADSGEKEDAQKY